ncbi:RlpA-like double-psi beta-barrel-protein domain-containing protein-containing protein [Suillus paluster]|uniref:RlpA-like double-psi beta-barrel-protein domain-containing protein-containing protein n=1 Tax=Suillus paluster TaxID=48578 RepID=UPI001B85E029|nr:RlpA-like double-psi beta-barrel-protein domain-containing protein-containing protein [Suillus paluster]KAG1721195.1 RlpA-like double-psi beta-barrel-protein domain-containing protein-containing protein [Suillus paluster]
MLVLAIFVFAFVSTVLPFTAGRVHGLQRERHEELAQRARGDVGIHKRAFYGARFTFYDVGLGACGQYNSPDDFIVALNVAQFGIGYPGPNCFQTITITYGGNTAQATIMDKCMGCPWGGLDFSRGLFNHFASEDVGVVYGSWSFDDGPSEPTSSY